MIFIINQILEFIRNKTFWLIDTLKGKPVKKHYVEIRNILDNFDKSAKKRETNIKALLKHSITTTPFYKNLNLTEHDFEQFPVINKNIINNDLKAFRSRAYVGKKTTIKFTSGSTGTPFKVFHNQNKIYRNNADTIYFSRLAGFKVGYQLWYLRYWGLNFKKSKFKNWIQNLKPVKVLNLSENRIESIIKKIKRSRGNKGWLGFPSAFEQICKYLDHKNAEPIDANFKFIIGMSEGINDYTKKRMSYYFNCPMVSRYSNMENGILAQQLANQVVFQMNWASYYFEILNMDNDQIAKKGELGRIVVTDLYNYAMPLIRYDTGDIGTIDYTASPPTLKKIEGRKTDAIFDTQGDIVSSFIMINSIRYKGIKQIQLIQEDRINYTIKLNCTKRFKSRKKLTKKFKKFLGSDAEIKIEVTDEIPLLTSGKRKMTLNNYVK
jgi:phenylacetate-CoA ligase